VGVVKREAATVTVRTRTVRNRLVGDGRKKLKDAAGTNEIVSKTEARKLPKDLARAVDTARAKSSRVTVNEAVDAYARRVSNVLNAVDSRGKGVLSAAEAKRIRDPVLRERVLDVRAALQRGDDGDVSGTGGAGGSAGTGGGAAALMTALNGVVGGFAPWHESGDHGVNGSFWKVPGRTLEEVLINATEDPAAPWTHGEQNVVLTALTGDEAIARFTLDTKEALENERDDLPEEVQGVIDGLTTHLGQLRNVHLATGSDFGGSYLVGKAGRSWVAFVMQPYSD
jgi:hypothetical protein